MSSYPLTCVHAQNDQKNGRKFNYLTGENEIHMINSPSDANIIDFSPGKS